MNPPCPLPGGPRRCGACRRPIGVRHARRTCVSCLARFHAECWKLARGCPDCGCPRSLHVPARPREDEGGAWASAETRSLRRPRAADAG